MTVRINRAALAAMVAQSGITRQYATQIRNEARVNASPITDKTDAIDTEDGRDAQGPYTDVGYLKRHPGFFLWWHEVGTKNHPPTPHLRPAVRPRP